MTYEHVIVAVILHVSLSYSNVISPLPNSTPVSFWNNSPQQPLGVAPVVVVVVSPGTVVVVVVVVIIGDVVVVIIGEPPGVVGKQHKEDDIIREK